MDCVACKKRATVSERIKCCVCKKNYHYGCLNIKSDEYRKRQHEFDFSWSCPECRNVTRRHTKRNDDTPVRNVHSPSNCSFVNTTNPQDESQSDHSIMGDTLDPVLSHNTQDTTAVKTANPESLPTLQQISELLDKKLESMEQSILGKIAASLEISLEMIKQESKSQLTQINKITTDQENLLAEIDKIKKDVKILEDKNKKLQTELEYVKKQNEPIHNTHMHNNNCNQDFIRLSQNNNQKERYENSKKIVIYGLDELQQDDEDYLISRITYAFYEIAGIDITGYVEDIARLGRKGYRRPVVVEFISKRITRNILQSTYCFRNSGLRVAKYLNEEGRAERKKLQERMYDARKNGHHAIIRDNELIINGEIVRFQEAQPKQYNNTEETAITQNNITFQYKKQQDTNNSFRN